MTSLPRALALAFAQSGDPAIMRVLVKAVLITLAVFGVLGFALQYAFAAAWERWIGGSDGGVAALVATLVLVAAAWLLFRVVALFVMQFFAEDVVRAVEAKHYPQAAQSLRTIPLREEASNALRALIRTVAVNALALPVAVVLVFTAIGPALVFAVVNAVLLGRELQDMVWLRHRGEAQEPAPLGGATRFLLGGVVMALLAIPFLNLIAPIVGAAAATHMVHSARERRALA